MEMPSNTEINGLVAKLEAGSELSADEVKALRGLAHAMAGTVRVLVEQTESLEQTIAILQGGQAAVAAANQSAVAALKSLAPATATVDVATATKQIAAIRKDIDASKNAAEALSKVAGFAVNLVGAIV